MVFQAFLVALVAFFAYSSNKFLGDAMVNRPLVWTRIMLKSG